MRERISPRASLGRNDRVKRKDTGRNQQCSNNANVGAHCYRALPGVILSERSESKNPSLRRNGFLTGVRTGSE